MPGLGSNMYLYLNKLILRVCIGLFPEVHICISCSYLVKYTPNAATVFGVFDSYLAKYTPTLNTIFTCKDYINRYKDLLAICGH